jgi:hypothetical protein
MGKMTGCDDCFYAQKDEEEFPCNMCRGYSYYLHKDIYKEEDDNKAWAKVVEGLSGLSKEDMPVKGDPHFWPKFESNYDTVNKPKHYMLFEEQGIEVRDVIEKLVEKFELNSMGHSYMFASDYVQMMQYLMRFMDKNGVEDLKKARWYLDKLIEAY